MKYAILMSLVGAAAFIGGCSDDPAPSGTAGNGGSDNASSSSSSSSSSGMGGMGTGGTGGMGTGGMGTGGMGTGGMGTGGSGGSMAVCDNPTVVDKAEPAMRCQMGVPTEVVSVVMAPAATGWADKIVGFSTEYGPGNYGSTQVRGVPDVYPGSGDEPKAWAQAETDVANEYITVGYTTPVVAEAVWIYETFNPGAISKVTITAADGDHVVYQNANPTTLGTCSHILSVSTKTCSPISSVRIDLDSVAVTGYNEIDAVGLVPAK